MIISQMHLDILDAFSILTVLNTYINKAVIMCNVHFDVHTPPEVRASITCNTDKKNNNEDGLNVKRSQLRLEENMENVMSFIEKERRLPGPS